MVFAISEISIESEILIVYYPRNEKIKANTKLENMDVLMFISIWWLNIESEIFI